MRYYDLILIDNHQLKNLLFNIIIRYFNIDNSKNIIM